MSPDDEIFSEDEIRELIKDALKTNIESKKKYNKKIQLDSALSSTVKEFLMNFIIIGYDFNGKPQIIKHAKTQLDRDALTSLAIKYVSYLMHEEDR